MGAVHRRDPLSVAIQVRGPDGQDLFDEFMRTLARDMAAFGGGVPFVPMGPLRLIDDPQRAHLRGPRGGAVSPRPTASYRQGYGQLLGINRSLLGELGRLATAVGIDPAAILVPADVHFRVFRAKLGAAHAPSVYLLSPHREWLGPGGHVVDFAFDDARDFLIDRFLRVIAARGLRATAERNPTGEAGSHDQHRSATWDGDVITLRVDVTAAQRAGFGEPPERPQVYDSSEVPALPTTGDTTVDASNRDVTDRLHPHRDRPRPLSDLSGLLATDPSTWVTVAPPAGDPDPRLLAAGLIASRATTAAGMADLLRLVKAIDDGLPDGARRSREPVLDRATAQAMRRTIQRSMRGPGLELLRDAPAVNDALRNLDQRLGQAGLGVA